MFTLCFAFLMCDKETLFYHTIIRDAFYIAHSSTRFWILATWMSYKYLQNMAKKGDSWMWTLFVPNFVVRLGPISINDSYKSYMLWVSIEDNWLIIYQYELTRVKSKSSQRENIYYLSSNPRLSFLISST